MKEADLQRTIRKHLMEKYGAQCIKHHGSMYSEAGTADILCALPPKGKYLAIEVKLPDKKPTKLQLLWLGKYKEVGAIVGVVTSIKDVDNLLENYLDNT